MSDQKGRMMKKGLKKRLILCLSAALAVGLFSGMTILADNNDNATLSMKGVTARPGGTVEIPVSIAGNPGVIGFDLKVSYPVETLSLQEVQKGSMIESAEKDAVLGAQEILTNTPDEAVGETLIGYAGEDNAKGDEVLFTLVFEVADDAVTGEAVVSVAPGTATESSGGIYTVNATNTNVVAIPVNQDNNYAEGVVLINAETDLDKSGLENAIRAAQEDLSAVSVSEDGTDVYASEEWVTEADQAAFDDAIKAVQGVLDQEELTQADLDAACETLAAAQKAFDDAKQTGKKEVDKEALKNAIEAAQTDLESITVSEDGADVEKAELWTDQESVDAFAEAIAATQAVYENPDATDEVITQAVDMLKEAQKAFDDSKQNGTKEEVTSKDALFDALAEAMTIARNTVVSADGTDVDPAELWVTQDDMDALNEAINAAKAILTDPGAAQMAIDEQTEAVREAIELIESAMKPGTAQAESSEVFRVYGQSRYDTSLKIADAVREARGGEKFDAVIVTTGQKYADALSGSCLAKAVDAPILIADQDAQIKAVTAYIKANMKSDGTVYILGGEKAVPNTLEKGLIGYRVNRLGGVDRYETNLLILQAAEKAGCDTDEILVCTGTNFADSLSASATGMPILLVDQSLTSQQKAWLKKHSGKTYDIIGGENAVLPAVEEQLEPYASSDVMRLAGADRYATSVLVADAFFEAPDKAVLAIGNNFPDGLCGGPLAMTENAPLLLVQNGSEKSAEEYCGNVGVSGGYVLGGNGLISDATALTVLHADSVEVK